MKDQSFIATILLMLPILCVAQQANVNLDWDPHRNHQGLIPYGAASNSPEVHDGRSVTFRVKAPEAGRVELTGAIRSAMDTDSQLAFVKDEDGAWSLTVDPLPPDIYSYEFLIDAEDPWDRPRILCRRVHGTRLAHLAPSPLLPFPDRPLAAMIITGLRHD